MRIVRGSKQQDKYIMLARNHHATYISLVANSTAAFLIFETTATRTRIIPFYSLKLVLPHQFVSGQLKRNGGRRTAPRKCIGHIPHRLVDMRKECFIALTQVVEAGLTIRGSQQTILRTASIAYEENITVPTHAREGVLLCQSEVALRA